MAVASGSIYNAGTVVVPPYMSSNMYYGYVPPYRNQHEQNGVLGHADIRSPVLERCSYGTAMETDDHDHSTASGWSNNEFDSRLTAVDKQEQRQHEAGRDADTLRRRNRKRCNGDHSPASELKKFREEAVVTTMYTVVQEVQRTMDMPRCLMSQMHCM